MGKCVVKKCDSESQNHNKATGISFHTFPKDPERREKWIKIIRLLRKETDWIPSNATLICSKHFESKDLIGPKSDTGQIFLSNEAVPMLVSDVEDNLELPLSENMNDDEEFQTDDEINEILESPRKHEMRKIIDRLRTLSKDRLNKINTLQRKNKRLEEKNKKLKAVIDDLKKSACRAKKTKVMEISENGEIRFTENT